MRKGLAWIGVDVQTTCAVRFVGGHANCVGLRGRNVTAHECLVCAMWRRMDAHVYVKCASVWMSIRAHV